MTTVYSRNNPIVEFCNRQVKRVQNTQLNLMQIAKDTKLP